MIRMAKPRTGWPPALIRREATPGRVRPAALGLTVVLLGVLPVDRADAMRAREGARPRLLCEAAVQAAEQRTRIPDRLLAAIGRVESGRPDPASGAWLP